MNEALKKFSADLLKDFRSALVKNQDAVAEIKASGDGGTFKVIISTSHEDRQGDSLDQSKWQLDNYKNNPVVLWAHDYYNPPIGICTDIYLENGKLVAEGKFASEALNPFASQIAGLYEAGYINTTSVGYIQHEDGALELLEFSFVPVPANPYALSMRDVKRLNLNTAELVMKGIRFVTKADQAGDACELDDGSPGVLAEDPDNPGKFVCVPAEEKSKSNETQGDMDNELIKNLKAENGRHGEAVGKAIDAFKAIDEFKSAIDSENDEHLAKCMKGIDDYYETMGREENKSIDEFKSAIKSEHVEHVKCFDKAIQEFGNKAEAESDDMQKHIDEFTKAIGAELERHENAQMDLCKAEMGEGESEETKAEDTTHDEKQDDIEQKSGRQISAKNKEKIKAIIKSIEEFKTEHATEHEKKR